VPAARTGQSSPGMIRSISSADNATKAEDRRPSSSSRGPLEPDRQDDDVGLECIPQRLGDDRGSNLPSMRRQRLGWPAARDGHVDVFTGEGAREGLAYLTETYNCIYFIMFFRSRVRTNI